MSNQKNTPEQIAAKKRLKKSKVLFVKGQLENAMFLNTERHGSPNLLQISDWSIENLRAMADYMEAFPNCTIYSDGSGTPCI